MDEARSDPSIDNPDITISSEFCTPSILVGFVASHKIIFSYSFLDAFLYDLRSYQISNAIFREIGSKPPRP